MNLLITGAWGCAQEQFEYIEKLGHKVFFLQNEKDALPLPYEDVEGVVCNGLFLHHSIEKFTSLKYIQLTSAGFDRVPMEYVKKNNISIYNARGVYSIPMAEFAVGGVLQLYKQSRFFMKNQAEHSWIKHRNLFELSGKTVCIVGCGSVGTECAKRFCAFGCTVFGVDMFPYESEYYEKMHPISELDFVLAKSDVVVLTLPLTEETKYVINSERIANMKKNAVVVNIARGAVIDTDALIVALNCHKIAGAVLDVFEDEPLDDKSSLWDMDNVIVTPHNSFVGEGNSVRLSEIIKSNLEMF